MIVGERIADWAKRFAAKDAIVCGAEHICWADLVKLTNRLSNWLDDIAPPQCSVALSLPNCAAVPILVLAIARSGRVAQVFDPAWPPDMTGRTIAAAGTALMITSGEAGYGLPETLLLDDGASLNSLQNIAANFEETYQPDVDDAQPFYTGFTSGSTGVPKGYRRSHVSWTESFTIEAREFGQSHDDIILAPGSLSHSLFLYAAIHALHIGATIILQRNFRPAKILEEIKNYRATLLYAVPSQLLLLTKVEHHRSDEHNLSLRFIISSGSKWNERDREILRAIFSHAYFAEFYGASELSFVSIARDDEAVPDGSVGRAFGNVDIRITGNHGEILARGETGEIFVKSPMLFDGYVTGISEPSLARDGDYASVGDMGRLDDNGYLFLVGRKDRMIVTAGKNLFPEEVESILQNHSSIVEAAIIGLSDVTRGKRIVSAIHCGEQHLRPPGITGASIIKFAKQFLPMYKVPRRYYLVTDWPRTRSGKTDFARLEQQINAGCHETLP